MLATRDSSSGYAEVVEDKLERYHEPDNQGRLEDYSLTNR